MVSPYHVSQQNPVAECEGCGPSRRSSDAFRLMPQGAICKAALEACRAGISVVPILPDGTKRPALAWRMYQHRLPIPEEIRHWFRGEVYGLALITGAISGGLEALDFDSCAIYQAWCERMRCLGSAAIHERLTRGYLEASPHGMHLLYRSASVERSQKLASVPINGPQRIQTLIETRGEGGLIIVAPSDGNVHPDGKPYKLLAGSISTIATICSEERQLLFSVARSFDRMSRHAPTQVQQQARITGGRGQRPGDCYNRRASWAEVLEPHGWNLLYTREGVSYWQRPGKECWGISATTNYRGSDLLYVFSTSTLFKAGRAYSKFAAYAILAHGSDFSAAARTLVTKGYGDDTGIGW